MTEAGEQPTATTEVPDHTVLGTKTLNYNLMSNQHYQEIIAWRRFYGGFLKHPKYPFLKMFEEMVELGLECGCMPDELLHELRTCLDKEAQKGKYRQYGNDFINAHNVHNEYGDVAACMAAFVEDCQINTTAALDATLSRIAQRTWSPDENGILRRPK
jgi:hypothetical protein